MKDINQKSFEEINAYHFESLNAEEKTLFEAKLIINPDLSDDHETFKSILSIIKEERKVELLEAFALVDKELDKDLIYMSAKSKLPLYVLAVIVVMITIVVYLLM